VSDLGIYDGVAVALPPSPWNDISQSPQVRPLSIAIVASVQGEGVMVGVAAAAACCMRGHRRWCTRHAVGVNGVRAYLVRDLAARQL
jgi:hypothetical protein